MRILILFIIVISPGSVFAETHSDPKPGSTWQAELEPSIKLAPPLCQDFSGVIQNKSSYKLCLPGASVDKLKIIATGNTAVLSGPGTIHGPVLIKSKPPMILIGSMGINKGRIQLSISGNGGYTMQGLDGIFEIEGLITALLASEPLKLTDVQIEFTSPEDATLKLTASNQTVGLVLAVRRGTEGKIFFTPSPTSLTIFPPNEFFSDFEGRIKGKGSDSRLVLKLKNSQEIVLSKE